MAVHPDTCAFLAALFERCAGGFLTFTALPPVHLACPTPSRHVRLNDRAGLTATLERLMAINQLGWGACVGIASRITKLGRYRRGGKCDLLELPALFIDLDGSVAEEQVKRATFPLTPSIRVSSGGSGHEHWYWLLDQPVRDLVLADRALRGLAQWLWGDLMMTTAQSMRLPGTLNTKPARDNALCHVLELHPERRYTLAQFEPYLATAEPPRSSMLQPTTAAPSRTQAEYAELVQAVERRLVREFDGFWKRNGWLSAICPFGHELDRPGQHFGFNGYVGHCFGRHGTVSLELVAAQLRLC